MYVGAVTGTSVAELKLAVTVAAIAEVNPTERSSETIINNPVLHARHTKILNCPAYQQN